MINRMSSAFLAALAIGVVLATSASGAESTSASSDSQSASCREVVRRTAIWPRSGNPSKGNLTPTFKDRTYTVCERKAMPIETIRSAANRR